MVKKVVRRAEVKGHRHGFRVSGVLLIEAADNPRPVHKLCHQTQHPKQDHTTSSLPEHSQNPFQACPSTRRNRLSKNRKKNNSAARLYPSLECFCTVVGSSSSSSCFSQEKHRKPARDTPRCGPETPGMAASPSTTTSIPPP